MSRKLSVALRKNQAFNRVEYGAESQEFNGFWIASFNLLQNLKRHVGVHFAHVARWTLCILCDTILFLISEPPKYESPSSKSRKHGSRLPSNPKEVEHLRRNSAANPLVTFTYNELKIITTDFRQDQVLGRGGFGSVYKGFIPEDLREGLQPLQVAVKVHGGNNSCQGHREWLVRIYFVHFDYIWC